MQVRIAVNKAIFKAMSSLKVKVAGVAVCEICMFIFLYLNGLVLLLFDGTKMKQTNTARKHQWSINDSFKTG